MTAPRLAARRLDGAAPEHLAAISRTALDRPMRAAAELLVAVPSGEAVLLGALQRPCEVPSSPGDGVPPLSRGSGGAAVRVGVGTVWVQLLLARVDALVPCTADRLINRHVRPLLGAVASGAGALRYYDRDWLSLASRPVGAVGMAHDAASGRALFEAFVACATPCFAEPSRESFRGRAPATLEELGGAAVDAGALAARVLDRYVATYDHEAAQLDVVALDASAPEASRALRTPWTHEARDAIGRVAASRDGDGALRVGGEWIASRDGVSALEAALGALAGPLTVEEARELAARALTPEPRVVMGLASLDALADVISRASRGA
jgi:hypothetical protein